MKHLLFAAATLLATPVFAADPVDLFCKMNKSGWGGWAMEQILIKRDASTGGEMMVIDAMIAHTNDGKPIKARVRKDNAQEMILVWRTKGKSSTRLKIDVMTTLRIQKASGAARVNAKLSDYPQNSFATGRCAPPD